MSKKTTKGLLVLLLALLSALLGGCASEPLTPEEVEERAQHEIERRDLYRQWEAQCLRAGAVILKETWSHDSIRCRRGRTCIPRRTDWDFAWVKRDRKRKDGTVVREEKLVILARHVKCVTLR